MLCLERAVGDKYGADQSLWDTGSCRFQAQVYPDLPLASTWRDLLRRSMQRSSSSGGDAGELGSSAVSPLGSASLSSSSPACPDERWTVRTVAAQLRSREQLRSMMLSAAGVDMMGEPKPGVRPADALLFVSGSHPARHLPGVGR